MSWVYLDGELLPESEAHIAAMDRGLLFARGVFETFRAGQERPPYRLAEHAARMQEGARVLGIPGPPTVTQLNEAVQALLERGALADARVRATLTAGPEGGRPSLLVQAHEATRYTDEMYRDGVAAVIAAVRRNETSPLSRIKSLNCLDNILAREEARRAGAVEALLLNSHGALAEGSASNVFVVRGDKLLTPPAEDGALPGVTRGAVIDLAREAGVAATETTLTLDDLHEAGEVFVTNAVAGVLPISTLDGAAIGGGRPGEVTRLLAEALRSDAARQGVTLR